MFKITLTIVFLLAVIAVLAACVDTGYYAQCVKGHWDVMRRCRPIDEVLAENSLPEARRAQLAVIREARDFASTALGLPDNGSYRSFADLERPYVVWNVVAAPEFSLQAKQWCFPVAGCVSYRGYFDKAAAEQEAAQLASEGYDTDVYGVQAYSTLNWFDDPVLSTFLDGSRSRAVALIFHELAHQVVYVADDSRFNEAFARTVELEGVRRWFDKHENKADWQAYQDQLRRSEQLQLLLGRCRERLAALYESPVPKEEMRGLKQGLVEEALRDYGELKAAWGGYAGYDAWLARGLNNARFASLATYHDLVPAFQGILAANGGDLPTFYQQVRELASLPSAERLARLNSNLVTRQARVE